MSSSAALPILVGPVSAIASGWTTKPGPALLRIRSATLAGGRVVVVAIVVPVPVGTVEVPVVVVGFGFGFVVGVLALVVVGGAALLLELEHADASSATAHPATIALRINTAIHASCSRGALRRARHP